MWLPGGAAATGWTAYPPLSAILYNSTGFTAAPTSYLWIMQITGSTWPTTPILINFLTFFMMYTFVGLHAMPIAGLARGSISNHHSSTNGSKASRPTAGFFWITICILLAAIAATLTVRALQVIAFDGQSCWVCQHHHHRGSPASLAR